MNIVEVKDKRSSKTFISLPRLLYKNDPNYISPLDKDIESVFDPGRNNFHKHGIVKRWLVFNSNKPVGRIAAFINYEKNKNPDFIIGGTGFFESINDKSIAFALFDTAKQWLQQNGANAMDVQKNYRRYDKYWV